MSPSRTAGGRSLRCLALVVLAGCAGKSLPEPVAFAESAAYAKLKSSTAAYLSFDVDGNGYADVLLFERKGSEYVPAVYTQAPKNDTIAWTRLCRGDALRGEELQALKEVTLGADRAVLAIARSEDPDTLRLHFSVIDRRSPCDSVLLEAVSIEKPAAQVIAPPELWAGVKVADDGTLTVIDGWSGTTLRGDEGAVEVITAIQARRWRGESAASMRWERFEFAVLEPMKVEVSFRATPTPVPDLMASEKLREDRVEDKESVPVPVTAILDPPGHSKRFVLRPADDGIVTVRGNRPIVVLQIEHGCGLDDGSPLEVSSARGSSLFVTGDAPMTNAPFSGAASARRRAGSPLREVLALRHPSPTLELRLGPVEQERCLRSLAAYGWAR